MFIKVVWKGKVTEVVLPQNGTTGDALKAAQIPLSQVTGITVTGVRCCADTQLRPDDTVYAT